MFTHNINPTLLQIGQFEIRYYGLVYVIGFLFSFFYFKYLIKTKKLKLKKEQLYDYLFYLMLAVLIGGRFFHVFIYNPSYYLSNPSQILAIWNGGMAFHGALLGIIITTYLLTKRKEVKVKFYELLDHLVMPASIMLFLGRIANFINGELYGIPTNLPWAVRFKDGIARHPTQIYEAIKNLFIFSILFFQSKHKHKPGQIFWTFILLYGILRFLVEFIRYNTSIYLGLSTAQYLCILMIIPATYFLFKK